MPVISLTMLAYVFLGPYLPGLLSHKGASVSPGGLALLADLGGRVRRCARRVDAVHLPVRAVRRAARQGRRRQFLHPGRLLAARPVPRRTGQGCRRVVRHDRHDLGLLRRQRGDDGRLHHPAHEARRLHADPGRRHRVRRRRQRPADAAGDGRGRLHHGRVRRHHLRRRGQARHPAGAADLRRALLRRRPGGGEGRHDRHPAHAAPHDAAGADQGRHHHLVDHHPERRHLLGPGLDAQRVRRGGELDRHRLRRSSPTSRSSPIARAFPDLAARRPDQAGHRGAGLLRDGAHGHPLRPAGLGADLVPDGGGDVAGPRRLLGRRRHGRRRADAEAADGLLPPPGRHRRTLARGRAATSSAAWSWAPATWRPSASPRPRPASWSAPSR